ncbi:MAG: hypothetical protein CME69_06205 [Halobacteriovorax sp.]|nr:hypothetical protein [Halobacteriovorax sp.]|tara:strand:+ start:180 stop:1433 length:1254 start_codon:yes stop_codon:yes gene_type:complete
MKSLLRIFLILFTLNSAQAESIDDYIDINDPELANFRVSTLQLSDKPVDHQTLKEWYHNMVELNKYVYGKISQHDSYDDSYKDRLGIMIANTLAGYWITRTGYNTMHEGAHAEAAIAFGSSPDDITYYAGDKKVKTIGSLFLNLLPTPARAAVSYSVPDMTAMEDAVISSAGLNAQTEFSRDRAFESVYEGYFHHTETPHYLMNKIINAVYYYYDPDSSSSDLHSYVSALKDQNMITDDELEDTKSFIAHASILTTLLSGRTWEAVNAFSNELLDAKSYQETLGFNTPIGKVTWPEFNVFLNKDNISIKTDAYLVNDNFIFGLSGETSVVGFEESEYSASVMYRHEDWSLRFEGIYNTQGYTSYSTEAKYQVTENFSVFAKAKIDDGTLAGRRQFFLMNQEFKLEHQVFIGIEGRFK